jgi:hypothetical protein
MSQLRESALLATSTGELAKLAAARLVDSHMGADGSAMWRLPQAAGDDVGETSTTIGRPRRSGDRRAGSGGTSRDALAG